MRWDEQVTSVRWTLTAAMRAWRELFEETSLLDDVAQLDALIARVAELEAELADMRAAMGRDG